MAKKQLPAKASLPTIKEIYGGELEKISQQNELNVLLNSEPNQAWIKEHPTIKYKVDGKEVPHQYIPIERIEFLLTCIFVQWRVEVLDVKLIANAISVTIRLHVMNPVTREWMSQDGVGASWLQTDKGAGATDFNKIKHASVQMALPAAKSYAISDAADHFGKIFGKDLNRKGSIEYGKLSGRFKKNEHATFDEDCMATIDEFTDPDDLLAWAGDQSALHGNTAFSDYVTKRRKELMKNNNGNNN